MNAKSQLPRIIYKLGDGTKPIFKRRVVLTSHPPSDFSELIGLVGLQHPVIGKSEKKVPEVRS